MSQRQQRRHVADAVDADHQPPLQLGDALQEARGVAAQRGDDRQEQEDVDRDEDREQPVPVDRRPAGTAPAGRRRRPPSSAQWSPRRVGVSVMNSRSAKNEAKREEQDHAGLAEEERDADQRHHHPPGVDARVEVVDGRDRRAGAARALEQRSRRARRSAARRRCRRTAAGSGASASWRCVLPRPGPAAPRGRARGRRLRPRPARARAARRR